MIGLRIEKEDVETAQEFFELFKTPWEFYQKEKFYDVVISADNEACSDINAKLIFIYSTQPNDFDDAYCFKTALIENKQVVCYEKYLFPVFNNAREFYCNRPGFLHKKDALEALGFTVCCQGKTFIRIGYDLFKEIATLLKDGQSREFSLVPTIEIHIKIMRDILIGAEVPFVEILPVPPHYTCIACLSHDVDFIGIRNHVLDRTMFGFLYRATLGSIADCLTKKQSFSIVLKNIWAALALPFVYLGIAKDFLAQFDKYVRIEKELGVNSTFFFVPFKNQPGKKSAQKFSNKRAVKYDLNSYKSTIQKLNDEGHEVGVHGLDAWCDYDRAVIEFQRLQEIIKNTHMGIRMHWLFFSDNSPKILEKAGFLYDSTIGYNDAVGFRAGTAQVFKAPGCLTLLELPLIIQDTALFYPKRMNLNGLKALRLIDQIIKNIQLFGGAVTINWHERSLGPERYWNKIYIHLIKKLRKQKAWFASAGNIVRWFQTRRNISFQKACFQNETFTINISLSTQHDLPQFALRVHIPQCSKIIDHAIPHSSARRQEIISAGSLRIAVTIN